MTVAIFDAEKVSLPTVRPQIVYTRARLATHPLTQGMVADWDDQLQRWKVVSAQELELESNQATATAAVRAADDELDDVVLAFANAVLTICKGDRSAQLYQRYFSAGAPSALTRPVLGRELEAVKGWVDGLKASSDPTLAGFGARFEALVAAGVAAEEKESKADAAMRDFRRTGARQQFFDALNALRKSTDGTLAGMPHAMPAAQLPKDFADRFFWRAARNGKASSVEDLEALVADAEAKLAAAREQLAKAKAAQQADADDRAKQAAAETKKRLDAAQKRLADTQAEIAALEAQVPKPA